MLWYTIASLTPAVLLALACLWGGVFPALGVLSITVFVFFMDKIAHHIPQSSYTGRRLSLTIAAVHIVLLYLGIWALGNTSGLSMLYKVLIFVGLGLYCGQVSNSNAHELIHASARLPRRIGTAIYVTLLHGHHVSAHLHVHHVHAATDADPNSARKGEGFWRYALRVMREEFRAGLHAENAHRARAQTALSMHPYITYVAGGILTLLASFAIAGVKGVAFHLGIALYAQMQLLLSDYVQHYGLRRATRDNGKPEPIGPHHSWNAPNWYSSAMMFNAPRHSDHHMRPARAFPALEVTPETMPILPYSLPVMGAIALFPTRWRRIMDRRVSKWQNTA